MATYYSDQVTAEDAVAFQATGDDSSAYKKLTRPFSFTAESALSSGDRVELTRFAVGEVTMGGKFVHSALSGTSVVIGTQDDQDEYKAAYNGSSASTNFIDFGNTVALSYKSEVTDAETLLDGETKGRSLVLTALTAVASGSIIKGEAHSYNKKRC